MKILTTNGASRTPTRWRVERFIPNEDESEGIILVRLFTTGLMEFSRATVRVRNGQCDRVSIDPSPTILSDTLALERNVLNLPSGFTDAMNAWRAGATVVARREALETWMMSSGVAGANLAGT